MSTSFPSALDSFVNPPGNSGINSPPHSEQHANANDAIEALEAKVGVDNSADPDSLDYRVSALEVRGTPPVFEVPTGTIDGVNTTFTISVAPITKAVLGIQANGRLWIGSGATTTTVIPAQGVVHAQATKAKDPLSYLEGKTNQTGSYIILRKGSTTIS